MNVELPNKYKLKKRDLLIYTISILACLISLIVVVVIQVMGNDVSNRLFGTNKAKKISEEEKITLKTDFENMFKNTFSGEVIDSQKIDVKQDFVYTGYQNQNVVSGSYTLNVNIPYINIRSSILDQYNQEIEKIFKQKAIDILNSKGNQIVYNVEYASFVEDNILTVVIRSNLKQGSSAQQVMIYTYNYDLLNKKEMSLQDMLAKLNLNKNDVQDFVKQEIEEEEKNSKSLKELGYNIYVRDSSDSMYMLENSKQFFTLNGKLYIVYAYGNSSQTSEMDLIIIYQ